MSGINANDDKLVFESSEAVKVVSTFDQLGLKEDLLRGVYAYGTLCCRSPALVLGLMFAACRIREAICHPTASYLADSVWQGCHRPSPIWDG